MTQRAIAGVVEIIVWITFIFQAICMAKVIHSQPNCGNLKGEETLAFGLMWDE